MRTPRKSTAIAIAASLSFAFGITGSTTSTAQSAPPNVEIDVLRVAGVPGDASGAVLNIAAARATENGYVTAWPCDEDQPTTSSLNFAPGPAISNSTIIALSDEGTVCLARSTEVDLIVDLNGTFRTSDVYRPLNPRRVLDSRSGSPVTAGSTVELQVAGTAGVPADAESAVLNIAAARPTGGGYVTAWPCGGSMPTAASLNFTPGPAISNTGTVDLDQDGKVCLFASTTTDLVVDVNGVFVDNSGAPFVPARVLDTRDSGRVRGGAVTEILIAGRNNVPADASAAIINLAATGSDGNGFVTAWPCDGPAPEASSLNYPGGRAISNTTVLGLSDDGTICLESSSDTHLVVDVNGAISASAALTPVLPTRLLDTRPEPRSAPQPPSGNPAVANRPGWPVSQSPFVESFDTPASLDRFETDVHHRSDHDDNVDFTSGPNQKLKTNTWTADHDLACGGPGTTRAITAQGDRSQHIYWCREHVMTSMGEVDGYSTIALSPKQVFPTVNRVCWDQNVTDLGGRQWTEVVITPANALTTLDGQYHLAHNGPGTVAVDNTAGVHVNETFGAKFAGRYDTATFYQNGARIAPGMRYAEPDSEGLNSRAIRRQHCLTDLGNGNIEIRVNRGTAGDFVNTVPGSFPDNARVIFEDHNYTPDKDGEACRSIEQLTGCRYTWHWDNVIVE